MQKLKLTQNLPFTDLSVDSSHINNCTTLGGILYNSVLNIILLLHTHTDHKYIKSLPSRKPQFGQRFLFCSFHLLLDGFPFIFLQKLLQPFCFTASDHHAATFFVNVRQDFVFLFLSHEGS